jgi:SAM-dependent methyltransferase
MAGVGGREQRLVFGEVADEYDEVRAGYPAAVAEAVFAFTGGPVELVEVGAGTGKATAAFAGYGCPITCIEPDPQMAAVLRDRFARRIPPVRVVMGGFEGWAAPPGGVPLIISAQAWHWVDPALRWTRASRALSTGGALALFGHSYAFADAALEADVNRVYAALAPQLLDAGDGPGRLAAVDGHWMYQEMAADGRFVDVTGRLLRTVVAYPRERYRRLLQTFSPHRMLDPGPRRALHDGIDEVVDAHGGVVRVALDTVLVLGRRAEPPG